MLGLVTEPSGAINKWSCKTPSTMCHLLGGSGPARELETAEGTDRPMAAPVWKAVYKLKWEHSKQQKEQNRCCCSHGSNGRWTVVSETGRTVPATPASLEHRRRGTHVSPNPGYPLLYTKAAALRSMASPLVEAGNHLWEIGFVHQINILSSWFVPLYERLWAGQFCPQMGLPSTFPSHCHFLVTISRGTSC